MVWLSILKILRIHACIFLLSFLVPKTSERIERLRRHSVPSLRVRLAEGRTRCSRRRRASVQATRGEGRWHFGISSCWISMEHHHTMGGRRGRNGVLLSVHASRQPSTTLAQAFHTLCKYWRSSPSFFLLL